VATAPARPSTGLELLSYQPDGRRRAPPLLFVHGAWHGAWCWAEHFMPYFAEAGYSCQALSLRGHGGSAGRERLRWTRLRDYVADVAEVAALLPTAPVLIGHAMGGAVVQRYLERHPAAGAALLASVPPFGALPATVRIARREPLAFLESNFALSLYPFVRTPERARALLFSPQLSPSELRAYQARMQDESYLAQLEMIAMGLRPPRPRRTPMLVLGGADDALIGPSDVRLTARRYGVEPVLFAQTAHDMMLEPRWREVADRVLAWLDELNR
jgi:pimeloyl-ACP methyl ester carboxylesterase